MPDDVQDLLCQQHGLRAVLDEIPTPLSACFGPHRTTLEVLHDGEEGPFLRLLVHLPHATTAGAAAALACFDDTWWLANCHRTAGLLVIDYALEDQETQRQEGR
jgi:hypothetical protein